MKIAILGAGAMGSLFGGYLSQHNDVWLIDNDREKIDAIRTRGVTIMEPEGDRVFYPNAVFDASGLSPMDLILLFVKAMRSREALENSRLLIAGNTDLLSLQNGAGHEELMAAFVPRERVIIGTTQHNSSLTMPGKVHHGGGGKTFIGRPEAESEVLEPIAEAFRQCGFDTAVSNNIKRQIWKKLFLNASASALTAILQVRLGFLVENTQAWQLVRCLIEEAVTVANAEKQDFNVDVITAEVKEALINAREGYTSIYADIRDGVPTEVDTISGSIVTKAKRLGISVPNLEFVVALIHSLEGKQK